MLKGKEEQYNEVFVLRNHAIRNSPISNTVNE